MSKDFEVIKNCLLCGGDIQQILSLGETPLANEFVSQPITQDLFPLHLVQCLDCNHVQLDVAVNEERMYRHYLYVSSTSKVNEEHFKHYAEKIKNRFFPDNSGTICEIASNDGCFLKHFTYPILRIGIDPAKNIAEKTLSQYGFYTIPEFFNEHTSKLVSSPKKVDVIVANNIFAHNKNLRTIMRGIKELLTDNGTFVFENSYLLAMLENNIFDVIYHEHIHHHHLTPLVNFLRQFDMRVYDAERLSNHGGSIRVYVCNKNANISTSKNVKKLLKIEKSINQKLKIFSDQISQIKKKLNNVLNEIKNKNQTIGIYGYPAKATSLMYGLGIDPTLIDCVVDDAILKQGLYTPGYNLKVENPEILKDKPMDFMLILGWNFANSIMENNKDYKGSWIIPLPELQLIDNK